MDVVDTRTRSRMMAGIRSKNTKPELAVRKVAHALGYRYRLHRRDLPGTPDLAFPRLKAAIQVHGCFWHRHEGCRACTTPSSNMEFWKEKFRRNVERDRNAQAALEAKGWRTIVVWECQTRDAAALRALLLQILAKERRDVVVTRPMASSSSILSETAGRASAGISGQRTVPPGQIP